MGNWHAILNEIKEAGGVHDVVRRRYLTALAELTGRNTIVYYSGWLQKSGNPAIPFTEFAVADGDKNGFMATIHQLDVAKYSPTLVGEAQKAIDWSNQIVSDWLHECMFEGDKDADAKVKRIVDELGSHELTKSHARHIFCRTRSRARNQR